MLRESSRVLKDSNVITVDEALSSLYDILGVLVIAVAEKGDLSTDNLKVSTEEVESGCALELEEIIASQINSFITTFSMLPYPDEGKTIFSSNLHIIFLCKR